jgi:hypothetical protein
MNRKFIAGEAAGHSFFRASGGSPKRVSVLLRYTASHTSESRTGSAGKTAPSSNEDIVQETHGACPILMEETRADLSETEGGAAMTFMAETGDVNEPRYSVMARAKATSSAAHDIASAFR